MIATVIKISWNHAHIYLENGETVKLPKNHDSFQTLQAFYDINQPFEFDLEKEEVSTIEAKFENLEDYELPEDFYPQEEEVF